MAKKICLHCNKEITDPTRDKFCCDYCMKRYHKEANKDYRKKKKVKNSTQIAFTNEVAKHEGLTYGQYVAQSYKVETTAGRRKKNLCLFDNDRNRICDETCKHYSTCTRRKNRDGEED